MSHIQKLTDAIFDGGLGVTVYFDNDFVFAYFIFMPVQRDGQSVMVKIGFAIFTATKAETFEFNFAKLFGVDFSSTGFAGDKAINHFIETLLATTAVAQA